MNFSVTSAAVLSLIAMSSLTWGLHRNRLRVPWQRRSAGSADPEGVAWSRCPYASNFRDGREGDYMLRDRMKNTGARERQIPLKDGEDSSGPCVASVDCDPNKPFRQLDGTCNNLAHPMWGSAGSCLRRELPAAYSDCVSAPRLSVTGNPLPSSRLVSMTIHPQKRTADQKQNNMAVMFAQFLAHDISLAAQAPPAEVVTDLGPGGNPSCLQAPECMPVEVPQNDDFYAQFNITRLGMTRTHICNNCGNGPIYQMNQETSYADLSQVYGYSSEITTALRRFESGLMLSQDLGGDEYMPDSLSPYGDHCSLPEENAFCLRAGDSRANQQPGILSMQTLWVREHNRVARRLACINPHWDDEQLFQVTKRIQEGRYQHIVYAEWLPWHLGPAVMKEYELWVRNTGRTSYDDTLDATLSTEFSSAHFRYSHTNVPGAYWRIDEKGERLSVLKLKDAYFVPLNDTYRPVDNVLRGSVVQPMEPFNRFGDHGLTHYLFRQRGLPFGGDLFAIDMQRARDHGVRPYVDWVQLCQNISITSFADLSQVMPKETARLYEQVYEDVRDIDLFSGALSETRLKGAEVGATFACGVASQLRRLKYGDRFYYEHSNQSGSFSDEQLDAIRQTRLTKILCENVAGMDSVPTSRNAFLLPAKKGDTVMCSDLPDIDLMKWKDENGSGKSSTEDDCSRM